MRGLNKGIGDWRHFVCTGDFFAEMSSVVVVTMGRTACVSDSVSRKYCSQLEDGVGVKGRSATLLLLSKLNLACCAAICEASLSTRFSPALKLLCLQKAVSENSKICLITIEITETNDLIRSGSSLMS